MIASVVVPLNDAPQRPLVVMLDYVDQWMVIVCGRSTELSGWSVCGRSTEYLDGLFVVGPLNIWVVCL